jgi:ABC-type uncharacterized transport system substrate-binding protein
MLPGSVLVLQRAQLADLAAKNRLRAIYPQTDYTEAGGLMYYGTNTPDLFRRAATYVDKILKGRKARRSAGGAANEVRVGNQSQDREADWSYDSADSAHAGGEGDQVSEENQAALPGLN